MEYFQLNSYYRLLIHKIGDYYGLARQNDSVRKCIILYKTSVTKEPINKLKDLTRKFSIMQRKVENTPVTSQNTTEIHSFKDREAIYEATRARIFSEPTTADTSSSSINGVSGPISIGNLEILNTS